MIFFIFDLQLSTLIIRLQPSTNKIKVSLRYIPLHPFTIALARHNYFINESKNKILLTSIIVDIVDQLIWWFVREKSFHGRIKIYPSYIFYWILEKKIHLFDSPRGTSLFSKFRMDVKKVDWWLGIISFITLLTIIGNSR